MDQMDVSEVVRENKTNMTSEEQVKAIIRATRELEEKKTVIYEQLMGELEPKGIRLINFNKLSAEEGKILEEYFDREIAPYLSANIVSKQQPFPFLKNKDIYAVALLESKGGKTRTAIIPCSNNVFRRLIDIPTRKGTFLLSEELILQFLPKFFKNYSVKEKSLIRVTRNADIDTEMIYDEDLDYRDAMENLIKERKRMNPVRMEFTGTLNKKMMHALCKTIHVETVVLLSHKKADSYIHIDVEFGEGEGKIPVDSIAKRAEAYKPKEKVTYKMIKEYIEAKYGFKVHTAYIAEVKRDLGLPMYDAPNAVEELKQPRKHPTPEKVEAIKDALRYFAVI